MSSWNVPIVHYSTKLEVKCLTGPVFENLFPVIFKITDDARSPETPLNLSVIHLRMAVYYCIPPEDGLSTETCSGSNDEEGRFLKNSDDGA
jgi:hypothetical protein